MTLNAKKQIRLSRKEKLTLDYALNGINEEVFLYGSRTFDNKKGGDIDILIYSNAEVYSLSKKVATRFFSQCESKIDVLIVPTGNLNPAKKAFIQTLNLVKLK